MDLEDVEHMDIIEASMVIKMSFFQKLRFLFFDTSKSTLFALNSPKQGNMKGTITFKKSKDNG